MKPLFKFKVGSYYYLSGQPFRCISRTGDTASFRPMPGSYIFETTITSRYGREIATFIEPEGEGYFEISALSRF